MQTLKRKLANYLPFISAIVGMSIVFGGIAIFYVENPTTRVATIAGGMLVFLAGMWFAANPYITNERRYVGLRGEVDDFIGLVRQLNRAAVGIDPAERFGRIKAEMHDSVERLAVLAGRELTSSQPVPIRSGAPGSAPDREYDICEAEPPE